MEIKEMLNKSNLNSPCGFAEQIVSFLYGEIRGEEKSSFESHLQKCSVCADELASFSSIRSSIQEWHLEDFAGLSTPNFAMTPPNSAQNAANSWLDSIRAFFAFSPKTLAATFAVAALLFSGLLWFGSSAFRNNEIAESKTGKINQPVSSPKTEAVNDNSVSAAIEQKSESVSQSRQTVQASGNPVKNNRVPVKEVSSKSVADPHLTKVKSSEPVKTIKNNSKVPAKTTNKNNVPSVVAEEYEDDSLRLSDIFKEVSLK